MTEYSRAEAVADLMLNPNGSIRTWSKRWGWPLPRVQRFMKSLEKSGAVRFEKSMTGSVAVTDTPDTPDPDTPRYTPPIHLARLDTRSLDVSRYESEREPANDGERLIDSLNRGLSVALGKSFKGISLDNHGSNRAAQKLLESIPVDDALTLVERAGRAFNPSNSHGNHPRSLGHPFFMKFVRNEWKRLVREQLELLPQVEMHIERSEAEPVERPTVAPVAAEQKPARSIPELLREGFADGATNGRAVWK